MTRPALLAAALGLALALGPRAAAQGEAKVVFPEAPPAMIYGRLTEDSPIDPARKGSRHRPHEVKLEQGKVYLITLRSMDFNAYLRVEDAQGKALAEDDDGAGSLDAQVLFVPPRTQAYPVVATTARGGAVGWYAVSVAQYG